MSNPIRVATAALSGQIFAGRPTKDGLGFKEPRYDVTSDVLKEVVDKIGIGFQTDIVSDGEVVCTIKIVGPDHPAAPSADKLRELVGASEDILSALSVLSVAGKPIASLDTKLRDAINTLVPAIAALKGDAKCPS